MNFYRKLTIAGLFFSALAYPNYIAPPVPVSLGGTGVTSSTGTTNVVLSNSPTLVTPALGTPSALVGTNITGTATAFTASNVTTNANLTGVITSSGNATNIASQTGTGTKFVMDTGPTISGATHTGTTTFPGSSSINGSGLATFGGGYTGGANSGISFGSAGSASMLITNTTSGTTAGAQLRLVNDASNGLRITYTSSAYSGPNLTNGPSGETGNVFTDAAKSLALGTNATAAIVINTSAAPGVSLLNAVTMPGLASSSAGTTGTVCWTTGTGNLTVDTTTTCLLSTIKVKKDIDPLDAGIDEVMALRPVSYQLKDKFNPAHLGRQVGFIAEEVVKVDDRLISRDIHGDPLSVRYQQITAVLTKAIQEQQGQINELKSEIELLKTK